MFIFQRFYFKKRWTVSVKIKVVFKKNCKNRSAANKILADFEFRFIVTYFFVIVITYPVTQHYRISTIQFMSVIYR